MKADKKVDKKVEEGIQAVVELLQEMEMEKKCMWKSSGKVSHFFTRSRAGSGKILEIIRGRFLGIST